MKWNLRKNIHCALLALAAGVLLLAKPAWSDQPGASQRTEIDHYLQQKRPQAQSQAERSALVQLQIVVRANLKQ